MKTKISVIIPVGKLETELEKQLLNDAIKSVDSQTKKAHEVLVVLPKAQKSNFILEEGISVKVNVISNPGDTSFGGQVNLGASKAKGTHIMILGMDDELAPFYLDKVDKEISHDTAEMYLPLVINVNDDKFIGFSNQVAWAPSFTTNQGEINLEDAESYGGFLIYGLVSEKQAFIENGGIKPSIKLSFAQETLMRFSNAGLRIKVIPKLGYKRLVGREGSLTNQYNEMTLEEAQFWLELPKNEYNILTDRNIVFSQEK